MVDSLLTHWPQYDPLSQLKGLARSVLPSGSQLKFGVCFAGYERKFSQIKLICGWCDNLLSKAKELSDRDQMDSSNQNEKLMQIPFDGIEFLAEDIFIHLNIIMDRVAQLIPFWYPTELNRDIKSNNFNNHRGFFMKEEGQKLDREYADFVIKNTEWFLPMLKNPRDDFLIHHPKATSIAIGKYLQVYMVGTGGKFNSKILQLLQKHVPDEYNIILNTTLLRGTTLSIPDGSPMNSAIKALEATNGLSKEELEIVKEARKLAGGPLPDLGTLLDSVTLYLNFVAKHFTAKLSKTVNQ